ncbi:MAG TPA: (deoxy)nucleoside triphosphate pyrophosphohydrolase [Deltaproteobacteria bacterium]|nr:(deoxy)nucleoside triphosphate pyrophosphohydrolase [Deltaproteobacteria bacterium]HQI80786.1 (deoxy)nucleoside triphosphate pyrophosphohydrolase [Deltaproteobacteria bacterium]
MPRPHGDPHPVSPLREVAAAVIIRDGRVLIARRKAGQPMEGFWEFPGGKVEHGETPQQCLERELREELGIAVKAGRIIGSSTHMHDHGAFLIMAVEATIEDGELRPVVHDRIAWAGREELGDFNLLSADRDLLEPISDLLAQRVGSTV